MENAGIDPATPRMQSECSTIWANSPIHLFALKLYANATFVASEQQRQSFNLCKKNHLYQ